MNQAIGFQITLVLVGMMMSGSCGAQDQKTGTGEPASKSEVPAIGPELDSRRAAFNKVAPEAVKRVYAEGIDEVAASGLVKRAKSEGDRAPAFALPNANGETVRLAELLERGPVVLVWYRGGWCPYCNIQLLGYRRALDEFTKRGATLVAISPQTPDNSLDTKEKNDLAFPVLSDVGNAVARQYGVVFTLPSEVASIYREKFDLRAYNGDDSNTLPLAATYVIDTEGTIRYAFLDPDYRKRAEPADVLAALDRLAGRGAVEAEDDNGGK